MYQWREHFKVPAELRRHLRRCEGESIEPLQSEAETLPLTVRQIGAPVQDTLRPGRVRPQSARTEMQEMFIHTGARNTTNTTVLGMTDRHSAMKIKIREARIMGQPRSLAQENSNFFSGIHAVFHGLVFRRIIT